MTLFERTERGFETLASGLAVLGGLGLIFATLTTCISIILKLTRRTLDATLGQITDPSIWAWVRPILGEEELVTYGVGLALFTALPWVMIRKGHIKIDLFEPKFGLRFNQLLDVLGDFLLATIAYLILTRQWFLIFKKARASQDTLTELLLQGDFTTLLDRFRDSQESQILGIKLWPTYIVAEFCIFVFFIVACFCTLRSLRALFLTPRPKASLK